MTLATAAIDQLIDQAQNGDGQACLALYEEYKNGVHVSQNQYEAQNWLEKALDLNNPSAQLIKGLNSLQDGNIEDALGYLQLACDNDNPDAMNVLGQLYLGNVENVKFGKPDLEKGMELLIAAGLKGSVNAQIILGKCFFTGKWVSRDLLLSKVWLEKAAAQGSREAQSLLDEAIRIPNLIN